MRRSHPSCFSGRVFLAWNMLYRPDSDAVHSRAMSPMGETTSTEMPDRAGGLLEIRVLGEFAVLRDGEPVVLPPSRKTRALLAFLAVVCRPPQPEPLRRHLGDRPDQPRRAQPRTVST